MSGINLKNAGFSISEFETIVNTVKRKLEERGCFLNKQGYTLNIVKNDYLQGDEYSVTADNNEAMIVTGGLCGAFAAVGDYLRHCSFDGKGGFNPFVGSFALKPGYPIRGMYFASHFKNFYEMAPIKEVKQIIEDLALRGCNALEVWYDMHQYDAIDSPESMSMIRRLKQILKHAVSVGMKTVFLTLANESFQTSDTKIRAEWKIQNGYFKSPCGHYHVEICPNKKGGLQEILRQRRIVMEAFSDIHIDYICIWPYDQGGCTCAECAPWGARGYLKTVEALHKLYAEILPNTKLICSTWYFDNFIHNEWQNFIKKFNGGDYNYISYFMGYFSNEETVPDTIRKGKMPGGKGMIAFPEISMYGMEPWGSFGANPMPMRLQNNFQKNGGLYLGALPYSEGIFEDINKALMLSFYSSKTKFAQEVLQEYAHFELCLQGTLADDFVRMIMLMEETLCRNSQAAFGNSPYQDIRIIIEKTEHVIEIKQLADLIDKTLTGNIRNSWRWQILYLRATMDNELLAHDMHFSDLFNECAEKLERLYHADSAYFYVAPLTKRIISSTSCEEKQL